MARYARDSFRELKPSKRTPHRVVTAIHPYDDAPTGKWPELMRWVHGSEAKGHFRRDDGPNKTIFYFSDENTALAFKLRFG